MCDCSLYNVESLSPNLILHTKTKFWLARHAASRRVVWILGNPPSFSKNSPGILDTQFCKVRPHAYLFLNF